MKLTDSTVDVCLLVFIFQREIHSVGVAHYFVSLVSALHLPRKNASRLDVGPDGTTPVDQNRAHLLNGFREVLSLFYHDSSSRDPPSWRLHS